MNKEEIINNIKTIKIINNFTINKRYFFYNDKGLGDSVFNMILFRIIKDFIIKNNITIHYFTKPNYVEQIKEFVTDINNIQIHDLYKKPIYCLELWINTKMYGYTHQDAMAISKTNMLFYNLYYINFFNSVLKKLNFNISINKFFYTDEDLINRYNSLPEKYKNFDILILNSTPFSTQYNYNKSEWDNYIIAMNQQFKILTTTKVNGVLCTFDDNLTIKDIASLSTKAKIVIAINSGVFPGLLNYYTLTTVKHFYIFDIRCAYSYPNFENKNNITDITFSELESYLN
jgi:hypothetical protein